MAEEKITKYEHELFEMIDDVAATAAKSLVDRLLDDSMTVAVVGNFGKGDAAAMLHVGACKNVAMATVALMARIKVNDSYNERAGLTAAQIARDVHETMEPVAQDIARAFERPYIRSIVDSIIAEDAKDRAAPSQS